MIFTLKLAMLLTNLIYSKSQNEKVKLCKLQDFCLPACSKSLGFMASREMFTSIHSNLYCVMAFITASQ